MRYDALGAVSRSSASRYGTFTRSEATSLGLSRATLRRLTDDGVVAMRSAARLHHLDGFESEDVVELLSTRRLKVPGAVTHTTASLLQRDLVVINGFRCTGLARTLCDLGAVVSIDRVERALDAARRDGASLRWVRESVERLHRPGPAGTGKLMRLLARLDDGPARDSWWERSFELMLRDPRIPMLERQYTVRDPQGGFVARADLAVPAIRFAVEAHSRRFHFGRAAGAADEDRDHRLALVGWEAMYLGHQSTRRPGATRDLVAEAIAIRAELLGVDLAALLRTRP